MNKNILLRIVGRVLFKKKSVIWSQMNKLNSITIFMIFLILIVIGKVLICKKRYDNGIVINLFILFSELHQFVVIYVSRLSVLTDFQFVFFFFRSFTEQSNLWYSTLTIFNWKILLSKPKEECWRSLDFLFILNILIR